MVYTLQGNEAFEEGWTAGRSGEESDIIEEGDIDHEGDFGDKDTDLTSLSDDDENSSAEKDENEVSCSKGFKALHS